MFSQIVGTPTGVSARSLLCTLGVRFLALGWIELTVIAVLTLLVPSLAHSAEAKVHTRTSVVPGVGAAVAIPSRVTLVSQFDLRQPVSSNRSASTGDAGMGLFVRGGVRVGLVPTVSLMADYGYAHGAFAVDGEVDREHRPQLGIRVGRQPSREQRLGFVNRTRLDLRIYPDVDGSVNGDSWRLHLRPRNEMVFSYGLAQWMQFSVMAEALIQPSLGVTDMLQVRAGPMLHGNVSLRKDKEKGGGRPQLFWYAAGQAALSPVAMARYKARAALDSVTDEIPEVRQSIDPTDVIGQSWDPTPGSTLDLLFSFGIAVGF